MQKMQMRSANPLQTSDFSEMQMGHENLSQKNAKTIHFQHPSLYQTISHKWPIYFHIYMFHFMFSAYFPYLQFSRLSWLSSALL